MKHKIDIYIPVWDTKLCVLFHSDKTKSILKKLKFSSEEINEIVTTHCDGLTYTGNQNTIIILINRYTSRANLIGTLSHEAFHATQNILQDRDVKFKNSDGNEPHAYLLGFIMEQIAKKI